MKTKILKLAKKYPQLKKAAFRILKELEPDLPKTKLAALDIPLYNIEAEEQTATVLFNQGRNRKEITKSRPIFSGKEKIKGLQNAIKELGHYTGPGVVISRYPNKSHPNSIELTGIFKTKTVGYSQVKKVWVLLTKFGRFTPRELMEISKRIRRPSEFSKHVEKESEIMRTLFPGTGEGDNPVTDAGGSLYAPSMEDVKGLDPRYVSKARVRGLLDRFGLT